MTRVRELTWAIRFGRRALDNAEIKRMYLRERLPSTAIAEHFGCEASTICRRLSALGIARREPGRIKAELCHCGKPTVKDGGAKCKFHRKLGVANAARRYFRRKHCIRSNRWRVTHDKRVQRTRSDKGAGMSREQLRVYRTEKMRAWRASL